MRIKSKLNTIFIKDKKLKSKTSPKIKSTGRNNQGKITVWHRGGGHSRLYRNVDFTRISTKGIVIGLEYDPNRSAFLGRIFDPDNKQHNYILATTNIKKGDIIRSRSDQGQNGYSQYLQNITTGSLIHNLCNKPGGKGQIIRAPGAFGQLLQKTHNFGQVRLKSGQYRWFNLNTIACLGIVSNQNHHLIKIGKAGKTRWLGFRPIVRGVAINPVDHPHGGGEGKTSGGRPSVTPWGKPTKGK
ncbi:unnamed protein product [Choristocarpus tenellus]|uniref:ribosomal protein L2 n=1 Tax=Choristocarpus tenellus TaxID=116065 RepID=UPI002E7901D8|nr:ribosomal protein L2 [Choristocarpus tenellus]WBP69814.1 ribosomal protein L2 [Choristocarpus tenellus]